MTLEKCTLLVRHLPANLTTEDVEEMLKTFGAAHVYQMTRNPKMKDMAFAAFANPAAAQSALQNLHQLELFGRRLIVEYALDSNFPNAAKAKLSVSSESKSNIGSEEKQEAPTQASMQDDNTNLGLIAEMIGLNYPFSSKLFYRYPAPTPSIVSNIAKALIDIPKFYWQVLHLMNKMNLPAPFGPCSQPAQLQNINEDYQMQESEEESELESETEMAELAPGVPVSMDRPKRSKTSKRVSKKAKIQSMLGHSKTPADAMNIVPETIDPAEVFELPNLQASKKIEFKLAPGSSEAKIPETEMDERSSFGTFSTAAATSEENSNPVGEVSFRQEEKKHDFITDKELRENRMQGEGLKLLPAFKKYAAGTPSDRLYLKNLAKQVEENDLNYIYGRYVDQASEEQKSRFNIRLMKEGRMKGQAFVTLPDVQKARTALADTLGYVLHGKPIVVQFAHSAKS